MSYCVDDYSSFKSSLVSKNIRVLGKRTSVRLEPEMWRELKNIAKRESCTIHDICSLISMRKGDNSSLTAAIRVFLMLYFRAASTESGHARAGHGNFGNMKKRAGMTEDWSAKARTSVKVVEHPEEVISNRLAQHLSTTEPKATGREQSA